MTASAPIQALAEQVVPEWSLSPSKMDWGVMIYGGENPRTGFPQPPLEFQFYGPHYSRQRIEQRATDLAEREHRTCWQVRPPTLSHFVRMSDAEMNTVVKGHKQSNQQERRAGGSR